MRFALFIVAMSLAGSAHAQSFSRALPPESSSHAAPAAASRPAAPAGRPASSATSGVIALLGTPSSKSAAFVARASSSSLSQAVPPSEVAQASVTAVVRKAVGVSPRVEGVERDGEGGRVAAMAASHRSGDMDREVRCVAQAVYHEARGEPVRGQRAVADVVMNRARSGRWGQGACSVVNAPRQFSNRSSWRMPQIGLPDWDRAISIARDAVTGAVGVSSRLLNFRASYMGSGGSSPVRIGRHVFW